MKSAPSLAEHVHQDLASSAKLVSTLLLDVGGYKRERYRECGVGEGSGCGWRVVGRLTEMVGVRKKIEERLRLSLEGGGWQMHCRSAGR